MVNLPLLRTLDVTGYGLFPGDGTGEPGLHVRFIPGLTLILGANGLGKTTLVTMLYRLLTGPNDVSGLTAGGELGTARLRVIPLRGSARQTFAQRVADNAAEATARLTFDAGGVEVSVERGLRDLTLRSFSIAGAPSTQDEQQYQDAMVELAKVSTFSDWVLLLRYIVFYFEDRRSLVWDPSAQRQLLRVLFLEPDQAQHWADREREILEEDSRLRNMQSVLNRLESEISHVESLAVDEPEVREKLQEIDNDQQEAQESLDRATSTLLDVEARHERARLRFLTLEQDREGRYRELERAQLLAVNARLPQHSDSARYILAQILTEDHCLVCGSDVPDVSQSMESRIQGNECVICGSKLSDGNAETPIDLTDARITTREQEFQRVESELGTAKAALEESEEERKRTGNEVEELHARIAQNRAWMEQLVRRLPPEERELRQQRHEYLSMRAVLKEGQSQLADMRSAFEEVITLANVAVRAKAAEVQNSFTAYARDFLVEDCHLEWSPRLDRLGQSGQSFEFPAFGLALGGSDFIESVRRSGPDDVSESQREFIDISFRMALAKVAAFHHVTTLVMDAPESSLDAVFVGRAAKVLSTFSYPGAGNCLVVTSNIVVGGLVPALLQGATVESDWDERIVDLLAVATPTAAVLNLKDEYVKAKDELLDRARSNSPQA